MPNWCMNELEVSGETSEVKRFVFANLGLPAKYPAVYSPNGKCISPAVNETEAFFCFNALVPTPPEVLKLGYDAHDKISKSAFERALSGQTDGILDGYHWNIANWGTKWDIYSDHISPETMGWTEGSGSIRFGFETAWSPPVYWFKKVAEKFPSLSMKLHYEEPGCYFAGNLISENGDIADNPCSEEECDRLFQYEDEPDS